MSSNSIEAANALLAQNVILPMPEAPAPDASLDAWKLYTAAVQRVAAHNMRVTHGAELDAEEKARKAKAEAEKEIRVSARNRYTSTGEKAASAIVPVVGSAIKGLGGESFLNDFFMTGPTTDHTSKKDGTFVAGNPNGRYKPSRTLGVLKYGEGENARKVIVKLFDVAPGEAADADDDSDGEENA